MCLVTGRADNLDGLRRVLPGYLGDGAVDVSQAGEDCSEEGQASLASVVTLRHEGEVHDIEVEVGQQVRFPRDPVFNVIQTARRARDWEVLAVRSDIVKTNDVLSGVEADDRMSAHGWDVDTLEAFEALGSDPLAGEEEGSNGLADLRLVGTGVVVSLMISWWAEKRSETDLTVPSEDWWVRCLTDLNIEDEDRWCVNEFVDDFQDKLRW